MAYDPALSTLRDHARLRLDDIDEDNEQFPDETYDALIGTVGWIEAIATLADARANALIKEARSWTTGDIKEDYGDRVKEFRTLAKDARSGRVKVPIIGEILDASRNPIASVKQIETDLSAFRV